MRIFRFNIGHFMALGKCQGNSFIITITNGVEEGNKEYANQI